jgi:hypothetical protein
VYTDIALAREVGDKIFAHLREQGYSIKPRDMGEMGGGPIFDIIRDVVISIAADLLKDFAIAIFRQIHTLLTEHKEPFCASIEINPPNGIKIPEGPLMDAVNEMIAKLENLKEQQASINCDQQVTETPKAVAILVIVGKCNKHL